MTLMSSPRPFLGTKARLGLGNVTPANISLAVCAECAVSVLLGENDGKGWLVLTSQASAAVVECPDSAQRGPLKKIQNLIPLERIEQRIFLLRGERVMLSTDLARLYEVEPRALIQAVKRNADRFPSDFMFQLTAREFASLKSRIVISSWGGIRRAAPYAFTEQGVAMLSSVLRSKRAVQVNIEIMRTFVRLRRLLASNAALSRKLAQLEQKYDARFKVVFDAIRQLMTPPEPKRRPIGFARETE